MSWEIRYSSGCICDPLCRNQDKRLEIEDWNQRNGIREPVYKNRDKRLEIEDWNQKTGIRETGMQEPGQKAGNRALE